MAVEDALPGTHTPNGQPRKFAFNPHELADLTGIKRGRIYRLVREGAIPKLPLGAGDRTILIPAWALDVWTTTTPHTWPGQLPENDPRRHPPVPTGRYTSSELARVETGEGGDLRQRQAIHHDPVGDNGVNGSPLIASEPKARRSPVPPLVTRNWRSL
ncbi:MAG: helix-turn-helix domain-containing protein [Microthrixaceae bacterium]|nr:helix-turn-helix domain-containing protein [Microthrixaceae bacterium]